MTSGTTSTSWRTKIARSRIFVISSKKSPLILRNGRWRTKPSRWNLKLQGKISKKQKRQTHLAGRQTCPSARCHLSQAGKKVGWRYRQLEGLVQPGEMVVGWRFSWYCQKTGSFSTPIWMIIRRTSQRKLLSSRRYVNQLQFLAGSSIMTAHLRNWKRKNCVTREN